MSTDKESIGKDSNGFVRGVYVLTLSTVIVKIIGLIYKIPMLKLLGGQGMGYFNSAYEIYASFCVIATSGIPVAMSILISSTCDTRRRKLIFRVSLGIFFVLGLLCMAVIFALAQPFSAFLKSPETYYCLMSVSPAIFFICLSSAARGYFQGLGKMTPTAVSQAIEAVGKLSFGLCLAYLGARRGLSVQKVAALAVLGLSLSEGICTVYLFLTKGRDRGDTRRADRSEIREIVAGLLRTALPITVSASVLGITKLIDMTMIFRRLGSLGFGSEQINTLYGGYTTLCIPLFSLAPALVGAVALPLVPSISSARRTKDVDLQNETARRALKLTTLIAAPVGAGLAIFSGQILELIFPSSSAEIEICAPLLCVLGLSVLPSCIITVQSAILQAYERPNLPIVSMLIGSALKVAACYLLIGNSRIGMLGVPLSTFACDLVISGINMRQISRHTSLDLNMGDTVAKPYFCAAAASIISFMGMDMLREYFASGAVHTIVSVCTVAIVYFVLLLLTHTLDKNEFEILLLKKQNT